MKNKYFLIINLALFTVFSIILFTCNKVFTNSFWIPYMFLLVAFMVCVGITSYDLAMEKQRLSKDFIKQLISTIYLGVVCVMEIFYLIFKTENLSWLIIPNVIVILLFVASILIAQNYKSFIKTQEIQLKQSDNFKKNILPLVEDAFLKETNEEIRKELFNLKNVVKSIMPNADNSFEKIENEIENRCLQLTSLGYEEKVKTLNEINSLIRRRDLLIKGDRKDV